MDILATLTHIGLDSKQAAVYVALLELGTASVASIASKAGLKRPTTYLIVDELIKLGLAAEVPQSKKTLFTSLSPEKLLEDIKKQQELALAVMPQLLAIQNTKKEKPFVQYFQGFEGISFVYSKIWEQGEVWFFGNIAKVFKTDPKGLKEFVKKTKEKQVLVREMLTDNREAREYADTWRATTEKHLIRYIPQDITFPVGDSAVFGDSVVFFSFAPVPLAVEVRSKEISGTFRSMFELAWRNAVQ